jgi:ribosome-associated protein YbcJ (S4-like RNA binding protein)
MITLGQLLKLLDLVGSGGEVKELLSTGEFLVNGESDDRRGRKLYDGDVVTLQDGRRVIIRSEAAS